MPGLAPIYLVDRGAGAANAVVGGHVPANAWDKRPQGLYSL